MASETLTNLIDKDLLAAFKGQADEAYVAQEFKTGSTTVKKVLSDNNLTDGLVAKINAAGESDFSGAYADLAGKPTINGHEVAGALTAAGSSGTAGVAEKVAVRWAAIEKGGE